jgi:hypothetical protein
MNLDHIPHMRRCGARLGKPNECQGERRGPETRTRLVGFPPWGWACLYALALLLVISLL